MGPHINRNIVATDKLSKPEERTHVEAMMRVFRVRFIEEVPKVMVSPHEELLVQGKTAPPLTAIVCSALVMIGLAMLWYFVFSRWKKYEKAQLGVYTLMKDPI